MTKRRNPTIATVKEIPAKDVVGSRCAWDGCGAYFEGLMPPDWRWMLLYWQPHPAAHDTVGKIAMSQFCDRDAALCPEHAQEIDDQLVDLMRWARGQVGGQA